MQTLFRGHTLLLFGLFCWVLLLTGMIMSFPFSLTWRDNSYYDRFGIDSGRVFVVVEWWGPSFDVVLASTSGMAPPGAPPGWRSERQEPLPFRYRVLWPHREPDWGGALLSFPLWIPLVLGLIPLAYGWFRSRRRNGRHCHCGYDLTGNVSGRCPECGKPLTAVSK